MSDSKRFEDELKQLEEVVADLERGDLSLDDSIAKFEKGIELSKKCHKKLEEAEKKINILVGDKEEPFIPEE